MPRGKKKPGRKPGRPKGSTNKATNKLSLKTGDMTLEVIASDASVIERLMAQLNLGDTVSAPRAKAAPAKGRPGRPPKAATKPAAKLGTGGVTKTSIREVVSGATPTNHEHRIMLLALAASKSGDGRFTTGNLKSNASLIGITASTIPGSLSKLRKAGLVNAERVGRSAIYSLSAKGLEMAKRIAAGEVVGSRRGRKPKSAAAKAAAKKKAAAGKSTTRKKPGPKPGSKRRGRKPGPKPGAKKPGRKPGRKPAAKPAKKTGRKRGRPRKS